MTSQTKNKINSALKEPLFYLILITLLAMMYVVFTMDDAEAYTREEIEVFKDERTTLKDRIKEIQIELDINQVETNRIQLLLDQYEKDYKAFKGNSTKSWEAITSVSDAENLVTNTRIDIDTLKTERTTLFDERNNITLEINEIEEKIDEGVERESLQKYNGTSLKKAIGVKLSNSCLTLIKNNITSVCPSYEDLVQLDSSLPKVSGEFGVIDGVYQRIEPEYKESWRYYDHDDTPRIFVDPPQGMSSRISMITIENNFGIYFLAGDHLLENGTRSYHVGRHIDNCRNAILDSDNWLITLPDTIYLMRIGCPDLENLDIVYTYHNATELNVAESNDWKYKAWIAETKLNCKQLCTQY